MQETKHDKFKRVATKRVNDIIAKIDTLSNCANKSAYDYTDEDINKIFKALESKLRETKLVFKPHKKSEFKL